MAEKMAIVIPAYNAEKSLPQTLESVLRQTHADIEAWVVDDGSTDSTAAVAERFAASDSRVRVIRQENAGAYMARLAALKRIDAPWFGFVDADDTIAPDMYEKMLAFAEAHACDVVQCGVRGVDEDAVIGPWYSEILGDRQEAVLESRAEVVVRYVKPHLEAGRGSSFIWNKLYRNQYDFASFATFDHLTNYDDMIFNFQFFEKVNRLGFIREALYGYAQTAGSATRAFGERQYRDFRACAAFRKARGVPSRRWFWVNLRSAVATVLRARLSVAEKMKWIVRLVGGV